MEPCDSTFWIDVRGYVHVSLTSIRETITHKLRCNKHSTCSQTFAQTSTPSLFTVLWICAVTRYDYNSSPVTSAWCFQSTRSGWSTAIAIPAQCNWHNENSITDSTPKNMDARVLLHVGDNISDENTARMPLVYAFLLLEGVWWKCEKPNVCRTLDAYTRW